MRIESSQGNVGVKQAEYASVVVRVAMCAGNVSCSRLIKLINSSCSKKTDTPGTNTHARAHTHITHLPEKGPIVKNIVHTRKGTIH